MMAGQNIAEYAMIVSAILGALIVMRAHLTNAVKDVSIASIMQLGNNEDFALNNYGMEKNYELAGRLATDSGESGSTTERVDFLSGGGVTRSVAGKVDTLFSNRTTRGD